MTRPLQVPNRYLAPYASLADERRRTVAGMLAAVDEAIGRIVDSFTQAGIREETLIIFSGDNGGQRPGTNGPLRDFKGSLYEGDQAAAEPDRVRAMRSTLAKLLADVKPTRTDEPADRPRRSRRSAAQTPP